jgi:uncharacterized protein YtpQ (UPF0354 family)
VKYLYDKENERELPVAQRFSKEIHAAILPVISKYVKKGHNIRQLAYACISEILFIASSQIYERGLEKRIRGGV